MPLASKIVSRGVSKPRKLIRSVSIPTGKDMKRLVPVVAAASTPPLMLLPASTIILAVTQVGILISTLLNTAMAVVGTSTENPTLDLATIVGKCLDKKMAT